MLARRIVVRAVGHTILSESCLLLSGSSHLLPAPLSLRLAKLDITRATPMHVQHSVSSTCTSSLAYSCRSSQLVGPPMITKGSERDSQRTTAAGRLERRLASARGLREASMPFAAHSSHILSLRFSLATFPSPHLDILRLVFVSPWLLEKGRLFVHAPRAEHVKPVNSSILTTTPFICQHAGLRAPLSTVHPVCRSDTQGLKISRLGSP